ncbi:hypothetical protein PHYC_01018 [Phycisphaerales bacterium]|nr:hypothetical protein PHYC_01018 [Phycisphaerales bacterium]
MRRSSLLARALICLVFGAGVTLLSSWALSVRYAAGGAYSQSSVFAIHRPENAATHPRVMFVAREEAAAWTSWGLVFRSIDPGADESLASTDPDLLTALPSWGGEIIGSHLPSGAGDWPDFPAAPNGTVAIEVVTVWSVGWPRRAMASSFELARPYTRPPVWIRHGAISTRWATAVGGTHSLPVHVLWPGFFANTFAFAAAAGLAWRGLIGARSLWRRRRGRCTRCAYPREGLDPLTPCPECGSPR